MQVLKNICFLTFLAELQKDWYLDFQQQKNPNYVFSEFCCNMTNQFEQNHLRTELVTCRVDHFLSFAKLSSVHICPSKSMNYSAVSLLGLYEINCCQTKVLSCNVIIHFLQSLLALQFSWWGVFELHIPPKEHCFHILIIIANY